jgi:thiamine transport system substrate-binding protein
MKKRYWAFIVAAILLFLAVVTVQRYVPVRGPGRSLFIYTSSSFAAQWGAGPKLSALFEERCHCKVVYFDVSEGGLILQRLALEKSRSKADMVVGLDQLRLPEARTNFHWLNLPIKGVSWSERFPQQLIYPEFVPFDWAPMTFIYKKKDPITAWPQSLDDLLRPEFQSQIALQDPRTSTAGLQFLFWVLSVKGVDEGFHYLQQLKPNVQSLSPSWSTAYGLFKRDLAKLVFSYVTSPVYHWQEEKDDSYQALSFREGHPFQLEYAAVLKGCHECGLAQDFVRFLLEPESQKLLMQGNYMLPVIRDLELGTLFEKIPELQLLPVDKFAELLPRQHELLERWSRLGY